MTGGGLGGNEWHFALSVSLRSSELPVVDAGVGTECDGLALAGLEGQAFAFDGGFGQGDDPEAAVEVVGWVDGLPDGIVVAEDLAMEFAVAGAVFAVEDGDEHPVRVGVGGLFHGGLRPDM